MTGPAPLVSVVICTQNRAKLLVEALDSLEGSPPPRVPYEIVVVDNGSVDATAAVIKARASDRLTYVHEATPGLSRARNVGWHVARGRHVAYLDDDATAAPGWVDAIAAGFAHDPGAGAIGGPVRPVWQAPRPHWLADEIAHALTILDWGPTAHRLDPGRAWLVGANIAFSRDALAQTGGFDLRLGRQGDLLLSNEETFLLRQMDRLGHGVLYWPAMEVHHPVPAARLDPRWLLQRHFWQGLSDARVRDIEAGPENIDRRALALEAAAALPPLQALEVFKDQATRFTHRCRAARNAGLVAGLMAGADA